MSEKVHKFLPYFNAAVSEVAVQISATEVNTGKILVQNTGGAYTYLQMFNGLAANVAVGTTLPDFVIPIPGGGVAVIDEQMVWDTGLTFACTSAPTGNGAPAANAVVSYTLR